MLSGIHFSKPEWLFVYSLLKPALFALAPEAAHSLTLNALHQAHALGLVAPWVRPVSDPVSLCGLSFANRVGIAAGLDKNAVCVDALAALGAGFVEIGTVTPKPQTGNAKPRVFRLPKSNALINRMGFPNEGIERIAARLQARKGAGIVGVNIGKNAATALEQATDDYLLCLHRLAPLADYITVNVSSPNTSGLRNLQAAQYLKPMLHTLLVARDELLSARARPLPLLVKLAPDLEYDELQEIAAVLAQLRVDGVIATNTTITRPDGLGPLAAEKGGLSGVPVHELSLKAVRTLRQALGAGFPIIGVGGIDSAQAALSMRQAGADLVQLYTGLIYRGPQLIGEVARALRNL